MIHKHTKNTNAVGEYYGTLWLLKQELVLQIIVYLNFTVEQPYTHIYNFLVSVLISLVILKLVAMYLEVIQHMYVVETCFV